MGVELEAALQRWYAILPGIRSSAQLAVDALTEKHRTLTHEFLGYMWALEGLHRGFFGGDYMTKDDYRANIAPSLVAAIPETLGPDHRKALEGSFQWGYQFSLKKRLRDLLECLAPEVRRMVLPDEKVPQNWIDTRNHFTHWDEGSREEKMVLEGVELHHANIRIRSFLRCAFLTLLELPGDAIRTAPHGGHRDAHQLKQLNTSGR